MEGAGQTQPQVGVGPWGFACASPLRKTISKLCQELGSEWDALLACRDRGCSSSGREQVERQKKRELSFEKKPY